MWYTDFIAFFVLVSIHYRSAAKNVIKKKISFFMSFQLLDKKEKKQDFVSSSLHELFTTTR